MFRPIMLAIVGDSAALGRGLKQVEAAEERTERFRVDRVGDVDVHPRAAERREPEGQLTWLSAGHAERRSAGRPSPSTW